MDHEPEIWRRILVADTTPLSEVHLIVQHVMGWSDVHEHGFRIGEAYYEALSEDSDDEALEESEFRLFEVCATGERFYYDYDFGDSWEHEIVVEANLPSSVALKYAVAVDGENACPPEDCGGVHRYETILRVIADASHEDHHETISLFGPFDPSAFNIADINARLQRL